MIRPKENDYAPFYAGYIKNVKDDVIKHLEELLYSTNKFLKEIPEDKIDFRYAEGKWNIKEVIGHLIDNERIMSYRALAISRNEKQPLPSYDEVDYIAASNYTSRKFQDIVEEFRLLREANLLLFKNLTDEMLERRGLANNTEVTVNAILFIIAGHEIHHLNILKERYLS